MKSATFNTSFYVVGATVIPVLFIALLIPDGALARYSLRAKQLRSTQLRRIRGGSASRHWGVLRIHDLLVLPVTITFLVFVTGEIDAVHALSHQHAFSTEHTWVETALVWLTIMAVVSTIASISFRWAAGIPYEADTEQQDGREPVDSVPRANKIISKGG
jgi:lysylphosphatidylglycerol synthetase-like protein (DUF2156 family)